jgi:SAM-dependent methyltransferase
MSDFDDYAHSYDDMVAKVTGPSGFAPPYFDEYKVREMCQRVRSRGWENAPFRFLNFGCGIGKSERFIRQYFPHASIYSIDISERSIEMAKKTNATLDHAVFSTFDGLRIPFAGPFDIIFVANAFHHIRREDHMPILRDIHSHLSERGMLFLFEHNPGNPLTRRAVASCPFDEDAVLLSPRYAKGIVAESGFRWSRVRFIVFFPAMLRLLLKLEQFLYKLPFGAQYYVMAMKEAVGA